jgi:uncharacterized damage-inducible protein DinB
MNMASMLCQIQSQFAYNEWANGLLLSAACVLDPGEQARDLGSSHRSVLGTLFHIVYSEWDWVHFWRGKSWEEIAREEPSESAFSDVGALRREWAAIVTMQKAFVSTLTEASIASEVSYRDFRGEPCKFSLAETIQHLLNHSSYHRGQAVTLLRQLGKTPPATDYLVFLREIA